MVELIHIEATKYDDNNCDLILEKHINSFVIYTYL